LFFFHSGDISDRFLLGSNLSSFSFLGGLLSLLLFLESLLGFGLSHISFLLLLGEVILQLFPFFFNFFLLCLFICEILFGSLSSFFGGSDVFLRLGHSLSSLSDLKILSSLL